MTHTILSWALKPMLAALIATGLVLLAQRGCVPQPDTEPRAVYELLRVDTKGLPTISSARGLRTADARRFQRT